MQTICGPFIRLSQLPEGFVLQSDHKIEGQSIPSNRQCKGVGNQILKRNHMSRRLILQLFHKTDAVETNGPRSIRFHFVGVLEDSKDPDQFIIILIDLKILFKNISSSIFKKNIQKYILVLIISILRKGSSRMQKEGCEV